MSFISHIISQDFEDIFLEEIAITQIEAQDLEPDEEELREYLSQKKKINLNRLDPTDLEKIPLLTPQHIRHLTDYLQAYGEVYSMYELQAVEGFDSALIQRLASYVEIGPPPDPVHLTLRNLVRQGRHDLVLRYQQVLQRQAGYRGGDSVRKAEPDGYYLGSPQRYFFRYRYTFADKVVIGISGDKDAGEEFLKGSQPYGMDFYSGFLTLQNLRWLKQLTIGHFRVSYGQGLTLGGSSFGSSVSLGSSMQYTEGFRPSQSVCEYGFLRGGALTIRAGPLEGSAFVSFTRKDATVIQADTGEVGPLVFSSISESRYHRTQSELKRKNNLREQIYGGHISYHGGCFVIGITGFYGTWSGSYRPKTEVFNRFALEGSKFGAFGIDGRCRVGFAQLFGEFSVSLNRGVAWLAGINAVPVPGMDLLLICRSYQPQYQNPFCKALAQGNSMSNEQGIFVRIQTQLIPQTILSGYTDIFRFPWFRYRINGPSAGVEAGIHCQFHPSQSWSVMLKYCLKRVEVNGFQGDSRTIALTSERTDDLKAQIEFGVSSRIHLRSCLVYRIHCLGETMRENGYLANQEVDYKSPGFIRTMKVTYSLFDIPFYDTRIYQWEPDVLYSWSAPAYYGRGFRCVLLIQAGLSRQIELSGWLGATCYTDRINIGSGLEEVEGNVKAEVKVQVRLRL